MNLMDKWKLYWISIPRYLDGVHLKKKMMDTEYINILQFLDIYTYICLPSFRLIWNFSLASSIRITASYDWSVGLPVCGSISVAFRLTTCDENTILLEVCHHVHIGNNYLMSLFTEQVWHTIEWSYVNTSHTLNAHRVALLKCRKDPPLLNWASIFL